MLVDHPNLRASRRCPICRHKKSEGSLVCWNCWFKDVWAFRYNKPRIVKILDKAEKRRTK